jgi:hypothetical protein
VSRAGFSYIFCFYKINQCWEIGISTIVINSVLVLLGTASVSRAGVQTGTEEAASRTGQDTG